MTSFWDVNQEDRWFFDIENKNISFFFIIIYFYFLNNGIWK